MPKLTLSDLDRELRNKTLRPLYLIFGPEGYLINTAVTRIKKFIPVEPDRFSGRDAKLADIIACAETIPMWTNHRLIIVDDADSLKEPELLERYLSKPSKTAAIILVAAKADGRTKIVQLCAQAGAVIECKSLYDDKIPDWVRMEVQSRNRTMSQEAALLVADLTGNNLGELASAIDRIILYIGKKKTIDAEDVETVLTETGRKNIFEFADAVGKRQLDNAVRLLRRMSEFNENEVMMLVMLARHWRILLKAREAVSGGAFDRASLPKFLGVNPFFLNNYLEQARLFSLKELKSGFKKLYRTDKLLKSSRLPKKMILERCVRELIAK